MSQKEGGLEEILEQQAAAQISTSAHHTSHHVLIISVAILFGVFLMMNLPAVPPTATAPQGFAISEKVIEPIAQPRAMKQGTPSAVTARELSVLSLIKMSPQLPYISILFYTVWVMVVGLGCAGFIEHKRTNGKHP